MLCCNAVDLDRVYTYVQVLSFPIHLLLVMKYITDDFGFCLNTEVVNMGLLCYNVGLNKMR